MITQAHRRSRNRRDNSRPVPDRARPARSGRVIGGIRTVAAVALPPLLPHKNIMHSRVTRPGPSAHGASVLPRLWSSGAGWRPTATEPRRNWRSLFRVVRRPRVRPADRATARSRSGRQARSRPVGRRRDAQVRSYRGNMPAEPERRLAGHHRFAVALRGYRPAEVDQALAELGDRVESLAADRDRLSEQKNQLASRLLSAIRRTNELDTRVKRLSASADSADGLSERIRVILELACAEANAMTTHARNLLQHAKASKTELDHRQAQLEADQQQLLASAQAEADQLRKQALEAASARRAEAHAEAERSLDQARTSAKEVVDQAQRAAAADVDRLREYLLAELPRRVNAVIDDAVGQLPSRPEGAATAGDCAESVVVPQQRQP
jgi:DivIVA domain-containing protein